MEINSTRRMPPKLQAYNRPIYGLQNNSRVQVSNPFPLPIDSLTDLLRQADANQDNKVTNYELKYFEKKIYTSNAGDKYRTFLPLIKVLNNNFQQFAGADGNRKSISYSTNSVTSLSLDHSNILTVGLFDMRYGNPGLDYFMMHGPRYPLPPIEDTSVAEKPVTALPPIEDTSVTEKPVTVLPNPEEALNTDTTIRRTRDGNAGLDMFMIPPPPPSDVEIIANRLGNPSQISFNELFVRNKLYKTV